MKVDDADQVIQANDKWIAMAYERWLDEHAYEDPETYLKAFQQRVPETTKFHKRPFGFTVACTDGSFQIICKTHGSRILIGYQITRQAVIA